MSAQLRVEIEKLKKRLLSLCAVVEDQVNKAVCAFIERSADDASDVERGDEEIDRRELEIEEECLKVLALHQPVATDLRVVVAVLKINNDLERIGDMAVNIARKALALASLPHLEMPVDIGEMWEKTRSMLRDSLDAVVSLDCPLAYSVCSRDDEIDRLKHLNRVEIEKQIGRDPEHLPAMLRLLAVSRNLERIADCAASIAEDVIYIAEGKIVRHGRE
jgi:phosphate transport system protein